MSTEASKLPPLPKWIDDLKGSDPTMDNMIHYIEELCSTLVSQVPGEAKPIDEAWGIWYEDLNGKKGWVGTNGRPALLSKAIAERDCVTPAYTPRRIVMYAADEITPTAPVLAAEVTS